MTRSPGAFRLAFFCLPARRAGRLPGGSTARAPTPFVENEPVGDDLAGDGRFRAAMSTMSVATSWPSITPNTVMRAR
jgi:hypothetical protein